jgi:ABC-type Fe3+ transport system substrate-binding protein
MLWIQYLLTEEAQQIMFAEYYSALPIHDAVFAQTIENHDALSFISTIRDDIDGSALQ